MATTMERKTPRFAVAMRWVFIRSNRFVFSVPDFAPAERFYTAFGLDVRRDGNRLDLRTHGNRIAGAACTRTASPSGCNT